MQKFWNAVTFSVLYVCGTEGSEFGSQALILGPKPMKTGTQYRLSGYSFV